MEVKVPTHVAIIMDGNGRWAQERGQERIYGHMNGVESVRNAVKASLRNGVKYLTLYAFSTENWGRPAQEVESLMELFCKSVVNESPELQKQGVRVKLIGRMNMLSPKVVEHFRMIEAQTAAGDKLTLILALNYSSKDEITRVVQRLAEQAKCGELEPEHIDSQMINSNLDTAAFPDPDLIIRTSGECRLSNFLLWQSAYSELYFTPVLWPDFTQECYDEAIETYGLRQRRYGLVTK